MIQLLCLVPILMPAAQQPSAKDLFDQHLASIRRAQAPDGSYGSRLTTAHVITAMALSPRAYRADDGPFMRDAIQWLIETNDDDGMDAETDRAVALALTTTGRDRYAAPLKTIRARLEPDVGPEEILKHTVAPGEGTFGYPLPEPGTDAAAHMLTLPERPTLAQLAQVCAEAGVAHHWAKLKSPADARVEEMFERGVTYLLAERGPSGHWEVYGQPEPGISALAARALLGSAREDARAVAFKTLDWLRTLQHDDGSIHGGHLPVYVTSVALSALAKGGRDSDKEAVKRAADYLRLTQTDEGEGYSESDKFYGGIGYGNDLRPDLSNLQYAMQALSDSGAKADDPAYQRALKFLQRSQNRSESNPETFYDKGDERPVRANNDGGAVYYPGNSPAGMIEMPDGSLVARSYGSMTYALLKCYFLAGLAADDPRIVACVEWIQRHWTLEVNPGFDMLRDPRAGYQGLYYYYLSIAEALAAAQIEHVVTPDGNKHDWRNELATRLSELQREDGSWINEEAERWWEGNPVLCTAYALNTLERSRP